VFQLSQKTKYSKLDREAKDIESPPFIGIPYRRASPKRKFYSQLHNIYEEIIKYIGYFGPTVICIKDPY
jgi:hypothetical protein